MVKYLKKIIQALYPTPPIAGLEISDFYIRFFYTKNEKQLDLEVRLTPGVVKDGKIIQKEKLLDALMKLRQKLGRSSKKLPHIIVTTHSSSVFLQTFTLPYLAPEKVGEAAKLNLQMISPLPINEVYTDWDMLGEDKGSGQLLFLGAFTERKNIDAIIEVCRETGFVVVAIEPSVLALRRAVERASLERSADDFYLLLHVSNEGMDFAGVSQKKVHFDYFISWLSMYEGATEITPQVFEDTVARYTQQVLNFALSHSGISPKNMVLVASEFHDEIKRVIEKNFNITVTTLDIFAEGKLSISWGVAYGAYLRGLIPRADDNLISLTSVGTEEEFKQSRTILFAELWRNITMAFGIALFLIFVITLLFLKNVFGNIQMTPVHGLRTEDQNEFQELKSQALEFNDALTVVRASQSNRATIYPHFTAVSAALFSGVTLTKIVFQSPSPPLLVNGTGVSNEVIKEFKKALEASSLFRKVDLPLNSITPAGGGRFSFSMQITLAK